MPRVLLIGHIHDQGMQRLQAIPDLELDHVENEQSPDLADHVAKAHAILLRTALLTPAMIDAAVDLKVVSRHGVGYDNVPVERLNARQIPLAVSASANMVSVAENAFAMMLALSKSMLRYDRGVRDGHWAIRNERSTFELYGKNLLLIGLGRIGRQVALRAIAFGMNVQVFDPYVESATISDIGAEQVFDLDDATRAADVISLHLPKTKESANLFDEARLRTMKPTAILINTARGGLIDEDALYRALKEGKLAGAGLDVFEREPAPASMKLAELDNVILAPHSAGVTRESMIRMATESAQNIVDILSGKPDPAVIVNWREIKR